MMSTAMKDITRLRIAIAHSIWICAIVLALFYIWFAVANRYSIFLYTHLGAEPFDAVTSSRYWMAGFVSSGIILVTYTGLNWILGRLNAWRRCFVQTPKWLQIWLICALPLVAGILTITMTQNWPTLPFSLALAAVGATLAGLALALPAGDTAAHQPAELIWLALYGLVLTPVLLAWRAIELPDRGLINQTTALAVSLMSLAASLVGVVILDLLRRRLGKDRLRPIAILVAGLSFNYLLLPLLHHFFFTPTDHRYITTAGNFFAFSLLVQLTIWSLAAAVVFGGDRLVFGRGGNGI
jgi:uncharacterized membrane protein YuzA (DUF378 family)